MQKLRPIDEPLLRRELEDFIRACGNDPSAVVQDYMTPMELLFLHGQWACTNDQPDKAIRSFKMCLNIEPNSPLIYSALSRIYMTRGELDKAERYARKSLQLNPNSLKNLLVCHWIISKRKGDISFRQKLRETISNFIKKETKHLSSAPHLGPGTIKD